MNIWLHRPRIGQHVQLFKTEQWYEVVSLRKARQILESLSEEQALLSRSRMSANMGPDWVKYYYEADVIQVGVSSIPRLITINTMDVKAIRDAD